jgi:hypothetical protein
LNGLNKRLAILEQAARPAEDVSFGPVLVHMIGGMFNVAVALLVQKRRFEACELVAIASAYNGLGLTDVQIDAAVRHIERHLASHREKCGESVRYPYWEEAYDQHHAWLRKDAAHAARRGGDEEERYAELVEFWKQRNGETAEARRDRFAAEHQQRMRAIASCLVELRQWYGHPEGPQTDEAAVYAELCALENSLVEQA